MNDMPKVDLPKWPAMLVMGRQIKPEQAEEILIRTDGQLPSPSSNTHLFDKEVAHLFGMPFEDYRPGGDLWPDREEIDRIEGWWKAHWDAIAELRKKLKMLDLQYLNNSQIVSSWIGGPHGWLSWGGSVFTNNYNIGKWPSVEDVAEEWEIIAKAFPYLELTCQLLSGETCEEGEPLVEFKVDSGTVCVHKCDSGTPAILPTVEPNFMNIMMREREIGIQINALEVMLEDVYGEIPQYKNELYDEWLSKRK